MGTRGEQQPAAGGTCSECGHVDETVRSLGLKIPYDLCDPCFAELTTIRTVAEVLPVSRILNDALHGADPLEAGRRSDTWRRNAPEPDKLAADERKDRSA